MMVNYTTHPLLVSMKMDGEGLLPACKMGDPLTKVFAVYSIIMDSQSM